MGSFEIGFSIDHNASSVVREIESVPPRIMQAMRRATQDVVDQIEKDIEAVYVARAGGRYWDINSFVSATPSGSRGYIVTPPNRPHPIDPKPERVGAWLQQSLGGLEGFKKPRPPMLRFEIGDKIVYARHVDHPGSNSLDWVEPVSSNATEYGDIYASRVAQAIEGVGSGGRGATPVGGGI